MIVYKYLKD